MCHTVVAVVAAVETMTLGDLELLKHIAHAQIHMCARLVLAGKTASQRYALISYVRVYSFSHTNTK